MKIYSTVDSFLQKKESESDIVGVFIDKILFPFQYAFNGSEKIVVFLPGAFDRSKSMPKFMRSNYFEELSDYNCISFFDPTLFLTDKYFSIGWCQGEKSCFYVDLLKELMWKIIAHLNIKFENILFFSTSAGGIPAFHLGSIFYNCKVFAGNVQTNLLNYDKAHVDRLLTYSYGGIDRIEAEKLYKMRLSIDWIDEKFTVFYAQNIADTLHYEHHFLPYINQKFKKLDLNAVTYNHSATGHSPLPKHYEIKIIKNLLEKSSFEELYKPLQ